MENQEIFRIEDLKGASWALRKIKECEENILEKDELAEVEKERIDKWLVEEIKMFGGTRSTAYRKKNELVEYVAQLNNLIV